VDLRIAVQFAPPASSCTISSADLAHQPLYRTPGHLATVSAQLRHPFRAPYTL
jgi:hypothetical protein